MTTHCPPCGTLCNVHGEVFVSDMTYEPVGQFHDRELELLEEALGELALHWRSDHLRIAALRTKVLELAFMEVSRDA
jgi:hypothetical protein